MINLLDMMVPMRSGSHRGVHAAGGVTYPAVTSSKGRKGTKCVCKCICLYTRARYSLYFSFSRQSAVFFFYHLTFDMTVKFLLTPGPALK